MNTPKPSIAILDDYYQRAQHYAAWSKASFATFNFFDAPITDQQALIQTLLPYQAVGLMRERTAFPAALIEQLPNLQLIVTSGKKNAAIDVAAAAKHNITVCGTESPGHATAELALLLMMSLSRQLLPLSNALKNNSEWQPVIGKDLRGQTLGIVGLGRLGKQLAGFAKALGMNVMAWSENLTEQTCIEEGVQFAGREQLFEQSDFVSIHLRHSARTHHFINHADLQRLGPQGYIINTSRSEIITPDDLKAALDNHTIAGAALDVFPVEPVGNDHWMINHPRILATPHIGYSTDQTYQVFYQQMLEAFEAYYLEQPIRVITP